MCGLQFQPTESSVHFSLMTPSSRTIQGHVGKQFHPPSLGNRSPYTHTQWFIQDGAHPHTANVVPDFLYETFNLRVMSHRFPERHEGGKLWPPHSPDINPCDFFLWGSLKEKVFQRRPENVAQLRAHIAKLCRALSEDLCQKVVTNARVHLQEVVRQNSGHIEHVLH